MDLKPSFNYYKQWGVKKKGGQGHKPVIPLRFSKSGEPDIERWYATHFVDSKQIAKLKEAAKELPENIEDGRRFYSWQFLRLLDAPHYNGYCWGSKGPWLLQLRQRGNDGAGSVPEFFVALPPEKRTSYIVNSHLAKLDDFITTARHEMGQMDKERGQSVKVKRPSVKNRLQGLFRLVERPPVNGA